MAGTIEELLAAAAVRDVQARYCRAADRMDFDLYRTCFHPDARLEFSFFEGSVDEFIEMARGGLTSYSLTTHFTGNSIVDIDGDIARCEFYTLATHRIPADDKGPERDYVASVRYIDTMEQRGGEWRIATRLCVLDWARTDPVPDACEGAKTGAGRRGREDPSYRVL